jgi:hypothetical protein
MAKDIAQVKSFCAMAIVIPAAFPSLTAHVVDDVD